MNTERIVKALYTRVFNFLNKGKFKNFGKKNSIFCPLKIDGKENISIGTKVIVQYKTWLAAVPLTGTSSCDLIIGDGSCIGNFNHIYATNSIIIGKDVLTADRVYISDNLHSYEDITLPIINQPIKQISAVSIGDGSWLGENVCVIGAKIGKNCVVGANSVVTKDIPDYSVVVGAPARIIKRYCTDLKKWRKTDIHGNWI
ncbi:acyltransferase [Flavobacterium sp.]|uniref:acyltransferase n=1 Tax=Flavobacterium sp. TaxID=239 RepID=UPI0031DA7C88